MKQQREMLTNENLKGICKSNFELALYAINLARYHIKAGEEFDVSDLLDEVRYHPDPSYLDQLKREDEEAMKHE